MRTVPSSIRPQTRRFSPSPPPAICRTCKETFSSRNALFYHLNKSLHFLRSSIAPKSLRPIVASKASKRKVGTGYAFRDYSYCEVRYQLSPTSSSESWGCADTGSGMSLVDESVLQSLPEAIDKTRKVKSPVHIKGVGDEMYLSQESVVLDVFLPDITNSCLAKITREFHVVKDMTCGLLLGNDIIEPEGIVMDLAKKRMRISSCDNMICQLRVRRKNLQMNPNRIMIRCAEKTVVQKHVHGRDNYIRVRFPKLEQEYPFKQFPGLPKGCFVAAKSILPGAMELYVCNFSGEDFVLPKDYKLGYIELPESPQYTPVSPVDTAQCHFLKAAEPESLMIAAMPSSRSQQHAVNLVSKTSLSSPASVHSSQSASCPRVPVCRSFVSSFLSFIPLLHQSPFFSYRCPFFFFFPPSSWRPSFDIPYARQNTSSFPPKPGWQHLADTHLHALC
jgi:hypothetical protein